MAAPKGDDGVGSADGPAHSRKLETAADDGFAPGFDDARADKEMLLAKLRVAHALGILLEIFRLDPNLVGDLRTGGFDRPQRNDKFLDLPLVEQSLLMDVHPGFLLYFVVGIQLARHIPQVLASMIQIDDLNCARKMLGDEVPDPFGAIADSDFLFRPLPPAVPGFPVDAFAKLFGVPDRARIRGGIRIADGVALWVPRG